MGSLELLGANLLLSLWIAGGFVLLLLLMREERKAQTLEAWASAARPPEENRIRPLRDAAGRAPLGADSDVIWKRRPRPDSAGPSEAA